MIWHRLAEMLHIRSGAGLEDERSIRAKNLDDLEVRSGEMTEAIRDMSQQARVGSYRRVRLPHRTNRT